MVEEKVFFIVEKKVLPEIIVKVMNAKHLMESGKEKTAYAAAKAAGISRSAFYKYKDTVFPFYENSRGKTVTIAINMDDTPGLLSHVLNVLALEAANILTINQTIPINKTANVTITIETGRMEKDISSLVSEIQAIEGVQTLKIIARE